jgi:uncharacterized protein YhaN
MSDDEASKLRDKIVNIENSIDQIKNDITDLKNEYERPNGDSQLCQLRAKQTEIESLMRKYKIEIENKLLTVFLELRDNDKNNLMMIETRKILSMIGDLDQRITKQDECNAMLLNMVQGQNTFNKKIIGHLNELSTKIPQPIHREPIRQSPNRRYY